MIDRRWIRFDRIFLGIRLPLMLGEVDLARRGERNPFGFKQCPLEIIIAFSKWGFGDFALRIDHAMPRNICIGCDSKQGIAHQSGLPKESGEIGDLSVGCNLSVGNAFDSFVDAIVGVHNLQNNLPSVRVPEA